MEYKIRDFKEQDIDQLISLCKHHAEYERAEYSMHRKRDQLLSALFSQEKQLHCIIAEAEGKLVGYASYTFDFSTWHAQVFIYLDGLYLEPDYRSYGIGKVLLERVKCVGVARNCVNMQWQTPHFNEGAIRFYNRMGAKGNEKVRFILDL